MINHLHGEKKESLCIRIFSLLKKALFVSEVSDTHLKGSYLEISYNIGRTKEIGLLVM